MGRPLTAGDLDPRVAELERQLAKLTKINTALMQRVERSMDQQANAYSLFQTAITLEGQVRVRTEELKSALSRLERTVADKLEDELSSAELEEELAIMQDDRSRLALDLDAALARQNALEKGRDEVLRRLESASEGVAAALGVAVVTLARES